MTQYAITKKDKEIKGELSISSSKSISNRALLINALSYSAHEIRNLSDSDDTQVMLKVLNSNGNHFDIGHAGTAMRFLTAYLSKIVGEWTITGSDRMQQRPITILVDALRKLGAQIEYTGNEGFPPLKITGSALRGGTIELDGSVSSQYISALLMIAPTVQGGLTLRLAHKITSKPYIELTLAMMKQFGVAHQWRGNEIRIEQQNYKPIPFTVEADWTGASYWYAMAALSSNCDIYLKELRLRSLQGDAAQSEWFGQYFGVRSRQEGNCVRLTKIPQPKVDRLKIDFIENPDLAQTFAVLAVCKKLPFRFSGLKTLKIKETDRIAALINELGKLGAELYEPAPGELAWNGATKEMGNRPPVIETYHDHRMALAFAPAALVYPEIRLADPMVVTKSYPTFYSDLQAVGFSVTEMS